MSKKIKITTSDLEKSIMDKIVSKEVTMKPRWYFIMGAILSLMGLVTSGVVAVFLTNLSFFLLKQHGPNGSWRLQQIIESFPIWLPVFAFAGVFGGILMLKKYDFSYQKNFKSIILIFIASILFVAFFLDYSGLNNIWMKQGPMRRLYQQNGSKVKGVNSDTNYPGRHLRRFSK